MVERKHLKKGQNNNNKKDLEHLIFRPYKSYHQDSILFHYNIVTKLLKLTFPHFVRFMGFF